MNAIRHARLIQRARATIASLLLCSLAGCTWVPLTKQGESVQAIPSPNDSAVSPASAQSASSAIESCKHVGAVTAQTKSRVGIFARSEKKILEELQSLARNDAAEMGANRIVAEGPPSVDGRQRFAAYLCER